MASTFPWQGRPFPQSPGGRPRRGELRAQGTQPTRVGGFQYLRGPDGSLIENAGNFPSGRLKTMGQVRHVPRREQRVRFGQMRSGQATADKTYPNGVAENLQKPVRILQAEF